MKTLDPNDTKKQVEDLYYYDQKSNQKLQTINNFLSNEEDSPRIKNLSKNKAFQMANRNIIGNSGDFKKSI